MRVEQSARQGRLLREGMTVVIAGRPNAGKSSLLNRLAGYDAAIVTPMPGTTRDVLRERIDIDGMPLHVLDTAGLARGRRRGGRGRHPSRAGGDRSAPIACCSSSMPSTDPDGSCVSARSATRLPADVPVTLVFNKCDLAVGHSGRGHGVRSAARDDLRAQRAGHRRAARASEILHGLPHGRSRHGLGASAAPGCACVAPASTWKKRAASAAASAAPASWSRRSCAPRSRPSARSRANSPRDDLLGRIFSQLLHREVTPPSLHLKPAVTDFVPGRYAARSMPVRSWKSPLRIVICGGGASSVLLLHGFAQQRFAVPVRCDDRRAARRSSA